MSTDLLLNGKNLEFVKQLGFAAFALILLAMLGWGGRFVLVELRNDMRQGFSSLTQSSQQQTDAMKSIAQALDRHLERDRR